MKLYTVIIENTDGIVIKKQAYKTANIAIQRYNKLVKHYPANSVHIMNEYLDTYYHIMVSR